MLAYLVLSLGPSHQSERQPKVLQPFVLSPKLNQPIHSLASVGLLPCESPSGASANLSGSEKARKPVEQNHFPRRPALVEGQLP